MIINDKALARALKRSGKAGFKLCVNGKVIRLVGWGLGGAAATPMPRHGEQADTGRRWWRCSVICPSTA